MDYRTRIAHVVLGAALTAATGGATATQISQSGLLLQSAADPKIALQIAARFVPIPPVQISLESTDVDRRIFVDADASHTIKRLVIVQFERVRPDQSFKFVYPSTPPYTFYGTTYRVGTYVYDDKQDAANAPNRESGATRQALAMQGYVIPRFYRCARLARVASPDGRSEIIIFYNENADSAYPAGPLPGADTDGDLDITGADASGLLARMGAAISAASE
jgi:hypothetical protein